MTNVKDVYQCSKCGNIYEKVYAPCGCTPVCCNEKTQQLEIKTDDPETQKHVPYFERQDGGVLVKVGKNTPHPMEPNHYIVYIQICADGILMRKYLKPGDKPEAFFPTQAKTVVSLALCNKHGLWKYE